MRTYQGNQPDENWTLEAGLREFYGSTWSVYTKPNSDIYINIKLISNYPVELKGNYWFTFNQSIKKFLPSRDLLLLKTKRPELFKIIENYFQNII